jgi:hypothetical protein
VFKNTVNHDHNVTVELDTTKLEAKYQQIKAHLQENRNAYLAGIGGAAFAGITCLIMRGVASQPISVAIGDTASGAISVAGKEVVMNNVSFISSNRQGSPAWVIRCLETNKIFTSQRKAAIEMGLSQSRLSSHLNGVRDNVNGLHFERICLAA